MNRPDMLPGFLPQRFHHPHSADCRITVAVSACLAGAPVRYDGGHRYLATIDSWLRPHIQLLPLCPEMEAGLGTPRPPVQLVRLGARLIARGRDRRELDVTQALTSAAARALPLLRAERASGYLCKSRSPSCGLGSTPLFDDEGRETGHGSGLQAAAVRAALPWLPMAEESAITEASSAWRFLLGCRLVHDGLWAGEISAIALARHHRRLHAQFTREHRRDVEQAATIDRESYLVALQRGCAELTTGQLQAHFSP